MAKHRPRHVAMRATDAGGSAPETIVKQCKNTVHSLPPYLLYMTAVTKGWVRIVTTFPVDFNDKT
jgi:hypothetical protein